MTAIAKAIPLLPGAAHRAGRHSCGHQRGMKAPKLGDESGPGNSSGEMPAAEGEFFAFAKRDEVIAPRDQVAGLSTAAFM